MALAAMLATPAMAHWADLSLLEIVVEESKVEVTLSLPTALLGPADGDQDGRLSAEELGVHRSLVHAMVAERIWLTDGERRGVLSADALTTGPPPTNLRGTPTRHSTLRLVYRWPRPLQALKIHYDLFPAGVPKASAVTTVLQGGQMWSVVLTPRQREFSLVWGRRTGREQLWSFLGLGMQHIFTGYDHILFLISLLLVTGTLREVIKVVTAFTVAHSITLSLAVLNVVTLPARWVESAIALSIVYVAAENLWRGAQSVRMRWLVTFGFGLVHGLGFASILREMLTDRATLALSLAGFNVGVEIGQVGIVTVAFVLLRLLARIPWAGNLQRSLSAAALSVGLVWFVRRALLL